MNFAVPDTLVLKIVEHSICLGIPDTTLYVLYDTSTDKYVIRGKRCKIHNIVESCTYSYECEYAKDLAEFFTFLFDANNKFSYILYNYDNLPATSNEITYEFLHKYDSAVYELTGYDNQSFNKEKILNYLRMLRNIINYY